MIIGGLDPGNTGAIGVYDGALEKLLAVYDLPGVKVVINKTERIRINEDELYDLFRLFKQVYDMRLMVIEQVMGLPKQSAPNAFQFGMTYGTIRTTARYAGLQLHDASPAVWKLQMKVPKVPDLICKKAQAAYPYMPQATWWGKRGGALHDRAEAAFLADYGWHKIWPSLQPREPLRKAMKELQKAKGTRR